MNTSCAEGASGGLGGEEEDMGGDPAGLAAGAEDSGAGGGGTIWTVIEKVVSGGQSGVDRAALDAALALGVSCGGWCPRGRKAEDGTIDSRYPLAETPSDDYAQRTEWNVRDADGTLVLTRGRLRGGTALTVALARRMGRPLLVLDLDGRPDPGAVGTWAREEGVRVLNVAGPRESQRPGIHAAARRFLDEALARTRRRA
jgi:hypothetical protein